MKKFRVFKKVFKRLYEEKFSPKYILSVFLSRTKISLPVKFKYYNNLYLKLHPTSITLGLWRKKYDISADLFVIEKCVKPNSICVDVGANIGHLSLVMVKKAKNGIVIAIEPSRNVYPFLLDNIKINNCYNIIPLNVAISNREGYEFFYEYFYADDQSSFAKVKEWNAYKYYVPAIKLSRIFEIFNMSRVDFLKIDVEGAELLVLKSLDNFLERCRYIQFEFIEENYRSFGLSGKEIFDFLIKEGFKIYRVINSEFEEIKNYGQIENFKGNLLGVKNE